MTRVCVSCALAALLGIQPGSIAFGNDRTAPGSSGGVPVAAVRTGSIVGTAWKSDNSPVSNGLLRLRDVTSGQILRGTEADAMGRFGFDEVPPGSYLVELVDQNGGIKAAGQMFSIGPGETIATFVRLGGNDRWFNGFFTNAAAAALVAAGSLGVTAIGDGVQPASPRF
jgi:hypothetical protein